jgi:hypothetical protein
MSFIIDFKNGNLSTNKVDKIKKAFFNKGNIPATLEGLSLGRKPVYSDVTTNMIIAELEELTKIKFWSYLKRTAQITNGVKTVQYLNIGSFLNDFLDNKLGAVKLEYLKKTFYYHYFRKGPYGTIRTWDSVTTAEIIEKYEEWIADRVKNVDENEDKVTVGDTETTTYTNLHS